MGAEPAPGVRHCTHPVPNGPAAAEASGPPSSVTLVSSSPSAATPPVTRVALLLGGLVALTVIGSSAVAVALPQVASDLRLDTAGTAWVLAAFSLTFAVSTAVFGRLADLHGLRLPLRVGVVLFAAGSLVAAAAPTFPVLIAGRLLQGAGAGAVPVLSVGVIAARFDDEHRGRALGALTAVVSVVSGSGPLIGGALAQGLGWRAVLGLPVLALAVMEPVARLAPVEPTARGDFDVRGALLVSATVLGVVLLLQAPATADGATLPLAALALATGAGLLLARHTRRAPQGFLPGEVIGSRVFLLGSLSGLTLLAGYLAMLFAAPALLSQGQGWTPLQIGLALLPAAMLGAVASRLVGIRAARIGRYRVVAALCTGSAAGLWLTAAGSGQPVLVVLGLGLTACGFAGGQVALVDAVPRLVPESARGAALGVFNLLFFVGGAVGSATTGGLADTLTLPGALAVVAVLPALGALSAGAAARRDPDRSRRGPGKVLLPAQSRAARGAAVGTSQCDATRPR